MTTTRITLIALGALVAATTAQARPRTFETCAVTQPRATSAFFRRLGRDAGNVIARAGATLDLPPAMSDGQPVGAVGRLLRGKLTRIWGHTESKLRRKCQDADAAAIFPGDGADVREVVDDLFTRYGLPWVISMRDLLAPHSPACAQLVLIQSGRAIRDQVKRGRDRWAFYLRDVPTACGHGVAADARIIATVILGEVL